MDKKDFQKVYNDYLHQGEEQAQFEVAPGSQFRSRTNSCCS